MRRCTWLALFLSALSLPACAHWSKVECTSALSCKAEADALKSHPPSIVSREALSVGAPIVARYERACEFGDVDACRESLSYWLERQRRAGRDVLMSDPYVESSSYFPYVGPTPAECAAQVARARAALGKQLMAQARRIGKAEAFEAVAKELPGPEFAREAYDQADALLVRDALATVSANGAGELAPLTMLTAVDRRCSRVGTALESAVLAARPRAVLQAGLRDLGRCARPSVEKAMSLLERAEDDAAFTEARTNPTIVKLEAYRALPGSAVRRAHREEALALQEKLAFDSANRSCDAKDESCIAQLRSFQIEYATFKADVAACRQRELEVAEARALAANDLDKLMDFARLYGVNQAPKIRTALVVLLEKGVKTFDLAPYDAALELGPAKPDAMRMAAAKKVVERRLAAEEAAEKAKIAAEEAAEKARIAREEAIAKAEAAKKPKDSGSYGDFYPVCSTGSGGRLCCKNSAGPKCMAQTSVVLKSQDWASIAPMCNCRID